MDFPYVFYNQMLWKIPWCLEKSNYLRGDENPVAFENPDLCCHKKSTGFAFSLVDLGKYMFLHLRKNNGSMILLPHVHLRFGLVKAPFLLRDGSFNHHMLVLVSRTSIFAGRTPNFWSSTPSFKTYHISPDIWICESQSHQIH